MIGGLIVGIVIFMILAVILYGCCPEGTAIDPMVAKYIAHNTRSQSMRR
jgi:hypothetical protein